jgi:hypothetical protein
MRTMRRFGAENTSRYTLYALFMPLRPCWPSSRGCGVAKLPDPTRSSSRRCVALHRPQRCAPYRRHLRASKQPRSTARGSRVQWRTGEAAVAMHSAEGPPPVHTWHSPSAPSPIGLLGALGPLSRAPTIDQTRPETGSGSASRRPQFQCDGTLCENTGGNQFCCRRS